MLRVCRWYDAYPALAAVLKMIGLMPSARQAVIGNRLNDYLSYRTVSTSLSHVAPTEMLNNRWYDKVSSLSQALNNLKIASHPVKQQSTEFLLQLLDETGSSQSHCA